MHGPVLMCAAADVHVGVLSAGAAGFVCTESMVLSCACLNKHSYSTLTGPGKALFVP